MSGKVDIMRGSLSEFELAEVLQVVGIGRQYTGVELIGGRGVLGTIFVKSGKIVSVDGPYGAGREALFRLFAEQDGMFRVFRMETPQALNEPLGPLGGLLMEVMSRRAASHEASRRERLEKEKRAAAAKAAEERTAPPPEPPSSKQQLRSVPASSKPRAGAPVRRIQPASVRSRQSVPPVSAPAASTPAATSSPGSRQSGDAPRPVSKGGGESGQRRVVVVASPKGGCGKTTLSLNLALSLARQGRKVILVDADLNGDVLSSINARDRAKWGTFDLLQGKAELKSALLSTVYPEFKILPAVGQTLPEPAWLDGEHAGAWANLIQELSGETDIVLIDAPAGMYGVTREILQASTHVLGVLQAEVVALRSFERFAQAVRSIPEAERPEVLGVLLNMLQTRHGASLEVFQDSCAQLPKEWLLDITIPRHPAFLDATREGLPLRQLDELAPPSVAWLFDNLAAEMVHRLKLSTEARKPRALLL